MDAYRFSISWSRIYPSKFTSKYVNFIYMYIYVYIYIYIYIYFGKSRLFISMGDVMTIIVW
jgi:hypothetical protein